MDEDGGGCCDFGRPQAQSLMISVPGKHNCLTPLGSAWL